MWARRPISGLWIIELLIGVDLIITGWTHVMLALAARKLFSGNGVNNGLALDIGCFNQPAQTQ